MNDYLKNISNIDTSSTSISISPSLQDDNSMLELTEQPPTTTSSSVVDKNPELIQDEAEYLLPQKIKLRKYSLKKG